MATPPYPTNPYAAKGSEPSAPPPVGYGGPPQPGYGGQWAPQPPPPPYNQTPQPAGYYQPPQQAGYYQPPQQAGYYQPPQQQPKVQTSHGLLGSLGNIGRDVAKTFNSAASEASTIYSKSVHGDVMSMMQTGRTAVLISRMSGRSLQIVQGPDGRLVVDASCVDSPQVFNNKWQVTRLPGNVCLLSNYNNYLAIQGGQLILLVGITDPRQLPPTANLKLAQSEHFILLESAAARGHYVAANERGEIKPPVSTSSDKYSHFGVMFY